MSSPIRTRDESRQNCDNFYGNMQQTGEVCLLITVYRVLLQFEHRVSEYMYRNSLQYTIRIFF